MGRKKLRIVRSYSRSLAYPALKESGPLDVFSNVAGPSVPDGTWDQAYPPVNPIGLSAHLNMMHFSYVL